MMPKSRVLKAIQACGQMTMSAVADFTGLGYAEVTTALSELVRLGFIEHKYVGKQLLYRLSGPGAAANQVQHTINSLSVAIGIYGLDSAESQAARARAVRLLWPWQPIETAKRDGRPMNLGWWDEEGNWQQTVGQVVREKRWDEEGNETAQREYWTDHTVASWGYQEETELHPTHWAPLLPPPPKPQPSASPREVL